MKKSRKIFSFNIIIVNIYTKDDLMKKILVVENEDAIREFIVINLKRAGYEIIEARNGEEALNIYSQDNNFQIVLLDIMMSGIDGLHVCKKIRENNSTIGIIMLTAKTQENDKVSTLIMGADDYVTKPFSPSELVARVNSLNRRVETFKQAEKISQNLNEIKIGAFTLNFRRKIFCKNGVEINLTPVEFQIVEYLVSKTGHPVSRLDILKQVWGNNFVGQEKIVDVNVRRIRMKIEDIPSEPKHLLTIRGKGYQWNIS